MCRQPSLTARGHTALHPLSTAPPAAVVGSGSRAFAFETSAIQSVTAATSRDAHAVKEIRHTHTQTHTERETRSYVFCFVFLTSSTSAFLSLLVHLIAWKYASTVLCSLCSTSNVNKKRVSARFEFTRSSDREGNRGSEKEGERGGGGARCGRRRGGGAAGVVDRVSTCVCVFGGDEKGTGI